MLSFPNQSRSYDATRDAIHFWGHDSAMEASFFVTTEALRRLQPTLRHDEASLLGAFDAHRERIRAAALKVYARGHRGSSIWLPRISDGWALPTRELAPFGLLFQNWPTAVTAAQAVSRWS